MGVISVLEHPDIRRGAVPLSVTAYHWMQERALVPRRAELIRGVIVEKMSKSPLYTRHSDCLREVLEAWSARRYWVRKEDPLTFADSEPEPDVSVVAGTRDDYADAHPRTALLVVEVAVAGESADRELIPVYASAGVAEFWLVLAAKQQIECLSRPSGDAYLKSRVYSMGDTLVSETPPGFELPLAELFRRRIAG